MKEYAKLQKLLLIASVNSSRSFRVKSDEKILTEKGFVLKLYKLENLLSDSSVGFVYAEFENEICKITFTSGNNQIRIEFAKNDQSLEKFKKDYQETTESVVGELQEKYDFEITNFTFDAKYIWSANSRDKDVINEVKENYLNKWVKEDLKGNVKFFDFGLRYAIDNKQFDKFLRCKSYQKDDPFSDNSSTLYIVQIDQEYEYNKDKKNLEKLEIEKLEDMNTYALDELSDMQ